MNNDTPLPALSILPCILEPPFDDMTFFFLAIDINGSYTANLLHWRLGYELHRV